MKTRYGFIGDVHGRTNWRDIIEDNEDSRVDHWIFTGDYADSFTISNDVIIDNLEYIIDYKYNNQLKCTLLLGNHDIHYLYNNIEYRGGGYRAEIASQLESIYKEHLSVFDSALQLDNYLITHAGVTTFWYNQLKKALENFGIELIEDKLVHWINETIKHGPKSIIDCITMTGKARGGIGYTGGPFWCDMQELNKSPLNGYNQIVGHTEQRNGYYNQIQLLDKTHSKISHIFVDDGNTDKSLFTLDIID